MGYKEYLLQERIDVWCVSNFLWTKVWKYCFIISYLIVILVLNSLAATKHTTGSHVQNPEQCLTRLNILIYLCVTGQPEVFKSTSGRIVILTSYMTSLVLMAAYSAFLISSLAVQHQHLPFRDLQGLLQDGSYRLGVFRDSYLLNMFEVCGRRYLWTDYLLVVGLGLCEKFVCGGNMSYQSSSIR